MGLLKKGWILACLWSLCGLGMLCAETTEPVKALSFNIRLSLGEIGKPNEWKNRRDHVAEIIRDGNYDFVGVQEAILTDRENLHQVNDLKERLPNYGIWTRSRMSTPDEGESTPILYRKDRWEMDAEEFGVFWLSDTPDVPQSITWENACPRTVVWGKFHERKNGQRTGRVVYFYNTHFDHISEKARQLSAVQIADFIAKRKEKNSLVILTGDFNCAENSPAIRYLRGEEVEIQGSLKKSPSPLVDSFRVVHPTEANVQTYHGYRADALTHKIDYVFVSPDAEVLTAKILRDKKNGMFPSDHFPIDATVR
ncbi:MAG: endonuclease/exonuclease/phosphatase family protein [Planctomycetia bacterium]|nr:endonuclease/exonuclease/phosphatase family protein [Planctomycetia bacterium]